MLGFVTGASSGLGLALSRALARQGFSLVLTARNEEKLRLEASSFSPSAQIVRADLSNPQDRKSLVETIHQTQPDLIINNAGFGLYGPAHTQPISDLHDMVEVNCQALMELSVAGVEVLLKTGKKGTILNISSAASFVPYPNFCVYAATKAFVTSFSQGLDSEVKEQGIRVLTICPGQIDTNFRDRASRHFPQEKNNITMSPEKAVKLILKAVQKGKSLSVIDWRYRLSVALSKLLPRSVIEAVLRSHLKGRYR